MKNDNKKDDVLGIIGIIAILVYAVIMFANWDFTPLPVTPEFESLQKQIWSESEVCGGL